MGRALLLRGGWWMIEGFAWHGLGMTHVVATPDDVKRVREWMRESRSVEAGLAELDRFLRHAGEERSRQ